LSDRARPRALTAVPGVRVGHFTDREAATGCTVVLGPFRAAVDVRGFATGTREIDALQPTHIAPRADALVLTGGSAFGLASVDGVMSWLAERGAGFETAAARVPIVPAAVVYDLGVGSADRRPDATAGRLACDAATEDDVAEGRVGAGTGATVGKLFGMERAVPGGVGTWAETSSEYTVGALAVVNAVGDVLDAGGRIVAGARAESGDWLDSASSLCNGSLGARLFGPGQNSTLAVVATDAPLDRVALQSIARAASTAVARRIAPVHTPFDGDVTFALSTAPEPRAVAPDLVLVIGVLAARALGTAIERAVTVGTA